MTTTTISWEELPEKARNIVHAEYDYIARDGKSYMFYKNTLRTVPDLLSTFLLFCKKSDMLIVTRL